MVIAFVRLFFRAETMTLKIRQVADKRGRRICLSGQLRSEHLDELKSEVERGGPRVTLDLEELELVDIEGVRFLNACESASRSLDPVLFAIHQGMDAAGEKPAERPSGTWMIH